MANDSTSVLDVVISSGGEVSGLGLDELEVVIERGQQTFIEVGRALMEIRDRRLYRETHATFEAYCGERWGWTRQRANQQIDAACVADALTTGVVKPQTEWAARAMLASLPSDEREQVRAGTATPAVAAHMAVHYSTGEEDWLTPPHIVAAVGRTLGHIDLDPCASLSFADNVPATKRLTECEDGLGSEWRGTVYMNPPYGRVIGDWVDKLVAEYTRGNVTAAVALVPARTDTAWFSLLADAALCLVRGRLKFGSMDSGAPFPSVAAYIGPDRSAFVDAFSGLGPIWVRWADD